MQTIAVSVPIACASVSLSHGFAVQMAEWIKILLGVGVETLGGPNERCISWESKVPREFSAAFARLLWPVVFITFTQQTHNCS